MTAAQYFFGLALLAAAAGCLARIGFVLRRLLFPMWADAPARLAEAVIAITALVVISELLGTVDLFRRWPLLLTLAATAIATSLAARRGGDVTATERGVPAREPVKLIGAGTVVVICLMLIPWFYTTLNVVHHGIREFDSLTYHLPFAARFVQGASLTRLQYIGNPPVSFYPMNSELVHAVGMLLLRRDLVSVVMNFGWLGLALLAAWCIGRPRNVALSTTATAAFVLSIRLISFSQGGTAKNDIVALALLLAAVGLWANRDGSSRALVLAAVAGGLAIGTRLNYWAPVLALALAVVVGERRGRRGTAASGWLGGIFVGGGFWYLRNLGRVGNPFPWIGLTLGGLIHLPSTSAPVDCGTRSVAHYVTRPGFVGAHLVPQMSLFLGRAWPLLLVLMLAGIGAGLATRSGPTERTLAFVALVTGVVYIFTPATAGGVQGSCFGFNLRFLTPALVLGILVLPLWLGGRGIKPALVVLGAGVGILVDAHIPLTAAPVLLAVGLGVLGCALIAASPRRLARKGLALSVAAAVLVTVAGGWELKRLYFRNRYLEARLQQPVDDVYAALPHKAHVRIAVSGFAESYPLYGVDLSNYVELPAARSGARFTPYGGCQGWIAALRRGRFDYVVTAAQGEQEPLTAAWTRQYPHVRQLHASPEGEMRAGKPWRWVLFSIPRNSTVDPTTACRTIG